jgi:hypothetical protein
MVKFGSVRRFDAGKKFAGGCAELNRTIARIDCDGRYQVNVTFLTPE